MNRIEKIGKLGRAVRKWRGRKSSTSGTWLVPPCPSAEGNVEMWLAALGLDPAVEMPRIKAFATMREFNGWISTL